MLYGPMKLQVEAASDRFTGAGTVPASAVTAASPPLPKSVGFCGHSAPGNAWSSRDPG